jgi:hypothetical protein
MAATKAPKAAKVYTELFPTCGCLGDAQPFVLRLMAGATNVWP